MGKSSSQTVSTKLDPQSARFRQQVYNKASQVGNQAYVPYTQQIAGQDPRTIAALNAMGLNSATGQAYSQAQGGIGIGMNAINGALGQQWNADTAAQYANPYQQQVMDAWNQQFGQDRQNTLNAINDQATQARAFGGSRQGVATGQALGDLARAQSAQQAGLLQQGYDTSYGQFANDRNTQLAGGQAMANLGFGGAQGLQGLAQTQMAGGDQARQIQQAQYDAKMQEFARSQGWSQQQLQAMIAAMSGAPNGQSQTQTTPGNLFGDILGLGAGVASFL